MGGAGGLFKRSISKPKLIPQFHGRIEETHGIRGISIQKRLLQQAQRLLVMESVRIKEPGITVPDAMVGGILSVGFLELVPCPLDLLLGCGEFCPLIDAESGGIRLLFKGNGIGEGPDRGVPLGMGGVYPHDDQEEWKGSQKPMEGACIHVQRSLPSRPT
jgi:hypothetical protein